MKALAHPLRIRMLGILNERVASPSDLADELDEPIGNVSYHMRTLADLGMVELVRTEPRRGAVEHYYRAVERPHLPSQDWAALPASVRRSVSDSVGRQVLDDLAKAAGSGGFERDHARLARLPLVLDEKGWKEVGKAVDDLVRKVERIGAAAAARTSDGTAPERVPAGLAVMLFDSSGPKAAGRKRRPAASKRSSA